MKVAWTLVFQDYLLEETTSYQKLAHKYRVSKRSIVRHAVKEQWQMKKQEILQKSLQNVTKDSTDYLTEAKRQHIEKAQKLQEVAIEALVNGKVKITKPSQIITLIKAGIELERKCWEIQDAFDKLAGTSFILPTIPIVPESKTHKGNMKKLSEMTKEYQKIAYHLRS